MTLKKAVAWGCGVLVALAPSLALSAAVATEYPQRPVRMIVGFAAGGGTDIYARIVAQKLSERFGQQVVVDNRPGAGGIVGTNIVAKAMPDGYTLAFVSPSHTINPSLYKSLPFDPVSDFEPVTTVASGTYVLVVHPALAAKTVKELIALAKAKRGSINFASAGLGSSSHLTVEQFKSLARIELTHVPYKGAAAALPDLISGQVQLAIDTIAVLLPHIQKGTLRPLGVGDSKRSALMPDVPTISEAGVPGYEMGGGTGVLAPAKTPREVIARLNSEINAVLQAPEVQRRFTELAVRTTGCSPSEYRDQLKREIARYGNIIRTAGITID